jgi:hypothetical protein
MATEALQKQTNAALTFELQPDEFLQQLEAFLVTIQDAYRSKLSDAEQQLWIRGLCQGQEKFSMQEMVAALDEMVRNPPLYEVPGPDGPITQKWRGMPKLPDLMETMLSLRSKSAREAYRRREEEQRQEQQRLEQRRTEHPEEFFGWNDLVKTFKEKLPELKTARGWDGVEAPAICCMPEVLVSPVGGGSDEVEPISPVLLNDDLAQRRIDQMKRDFFEHQAKLAEKFQPREERP